MSSFLPKSIAEDQWHPLAAQRVFAVRCKQDEDVYFRFGQGHGVYITIIRAVGEGRVVHSVDFVTGELTLIGKLPEGSPILAGRSADCSLKIIHPIMSRQHMSLSLQGTVLIVKDMGSTNGSYCLKTTPFFDINEYLEAHPLDASHEGTLDSVHEAFGPTLDDFLKNYQTQKEKYQ